MARSQEFLRYRSVIVSVQYFSLSWTNSVLLLGCWHDSTSAEYGRALKLTFDLQLDFFEVS